jgi:hypothetical protein
MWNTLCWLARNHRARQNCDDTRKEPSLPRFRACLHAYVEPAQNMPISCCDSTEHEVVHKGVNEQASQNTDWLMQVLRARTLVWGFLSSSLERMQVQLQLDLGSV